LNPKPVPIAVAGITTTIMTDQRTHLKLWQLISPSLPVGAYAYSGGLEAAIECGAIKNREQAQTWIEQLMQYGMGKLDIPVLQRLYQACVEQNLQDFAYWNQYLQASRESAELLQEDRHLGRALKRLLTDMDIPLLCQQLPHDAHLSYASVFACVIVSWEIPLHDAAEALLWSWSENQVAASIKLVPLGQTDGQRVLLELQKQISDIVNQGLTCSDDEIGFTLPGLGILSAQHEQQYSRMFRS